MDWNQLISNQRIPSSQKDNAATIDDAFESDYRRIIKSSAFRRLQDKTQVFPLERNDFVRTRLTHSLEVAMISRDILNSVIKALEYKNIDTKQLKKAYRLLECASLIHDIGNPPFGHFGESAIRIYFANNQHTISGFQSLNEQQQMDYLNFEGNAQTIRVLTKLHDYNGASTIGMRLTASVLDTVIKYDAASNKLNKSIITKKKVGYFYSEKEVFKQIKNTTKSIHRHPLVYLLEASDDISYTFSDLEDGFKYGIYSVSDLISYLNDDELTKKYFSSTASNEEKMQNFLRSYQQKTFTCVSKFFVSHYDEIMNGTFQTDLFETDIPEIKVFSKLKNFCFKHIFQDPIIIKQEMIGYRIINSLLDTFVPIVLKYDSTKLNEYEEKLLGYISDSALKRYHVETNGLSEEDKIYYRLKIAVDYICGMTDGYAKKVYNELFTI